MKKTNCLKRCNLLDFTLIELLIVVAIIAILAGMLLPALNKARESAHKIACASNHKNLTNAGIQYNMDNQDYFYAPVDRIGYSSGVYNWIFNITAYAISPYLGKKKGANVAGGLLKAIDNQGNYVYTSKIMSCPGKKLFPTVNPMAMAYNYAWNQHLGSGSFYSTSSSYPHWKLGSIRKPSAIPMYGDAGGQRWGAYDTCVQVPTISNNYRLNATHVRHGNMVLFSYVDGHATPMKTNRPVFYNHYWNFKFFTELAP